MADPYFSQDSNAHVLGPDARKAALLQRLIARCQSGYFDRLREPPEAHNG